jgi:hypothetical protein
MVPSPVTIDVKASELVSGSVFSFAGSAGCSSRVFKDKMSDHPSLILRFSGSECSDFSPAFDGSAAGQIRDLSMSFPRLRQSPVPVHPAIGFCRQRHRPSAHETAVHVTPDTSRLAW